MENFEETEPRKDGVKPHFDGVEFEAFNKLYEKLREANADRLLILYYNSKPYAFSVIKLEISQRTKMGRKFLDRIKEMGLI